MKMRYKIYSLIHQKLYDSIYLIDKNPKINHIVNEEKLFLLKRYKEIREDFLSLAKCKNINSIFSDIVFENRKEVYIYEHIVVKGNKIYILEREKDYKNQWNLLKKKTKYLKNNLKIKNDFTPIIITENIKKKSSKYITMEEFNNITIEKEDNISDIIKKFIDKNLYSIEISDYIFHKYKISIEKKEDTRKKKKINDIFGPIQISVITYITSLLFILNCSLVSFRTLRYDHYYLSIALNIIYFFLLYLCFLLLEKCYKKSIKIPISLCSLLCMAYIFCKTLSYL